MPRLMEIPTRRAIRSDCFRKKRYRSKPMRLYKSSASTMVVMTM